jgi:hypothetical protein
MNSVVTVKPPRGRPCKYQVEERNERYKEKRTEWNKNHKDVMSNSANKCNKKGRAALHLIEKIYKEREQLTNILYQEDLILEIEKIINQ